MSLLYKIVELIACILPVVYMLLLSKHFFEVSHRYRHDLILILSIIYIAMSWKGTDLFGNEIISFVMMLWWIIMIACLFQGALWKKCLFILVYNMVDVLITSLLVPLFLMVPGCTMDQLLTVGSDIRIAFLVSIYLTEFFVIIACFNIRSAMRGEFRKLEILVIFLFFCCDFCIIFLTFMTLVHFSGNSRTLSLLCSGINVVAFILTLVGISLFLQIQKKHLTLFENQLLHMQLEDQKRRICEHEKEYQTIHAIRHDLKRYLVNYRVLLSEGNITEVLNNINAILDGPLESTEKIYSNNSLLDALLHHVSDQCKAGMIELKVRSVLDPLFKDINVMVLLSNLFENAIEAEMALDPKDRLIRCEIISSSDQLSIVVQNKIGESVLAGNPSLKTSKSDQAIHGFGLKNVRSIVEQYKGILDIYEEDNLFSIHILIST